MMFSYKKFAIVVLGCPKNEVDAEVLTGELIKNKFLITDNVEDADVVIIFTCAFIKEAAQESINTILEYAQNKNVIVSGCLTNRFDRKTLKKLLPEVTEFFDTYNYLQIIPYLKSYIFEEKYKNFIYSSNNKRTLFNKNFAYVKISEGCNNRCSFCTIPAIKGNLFSRTINDIENEIKKLVDNGIYEIILISQNSGDYGKDLKDGSNLIKLVEKLLNINDLKWLRLLYLYPDNVTNELLNLSYHEKFCNYIDIPIQHIDNEILKSMNRKISEKKLREKIYNIKTNFPHIFLRTSLIVGFPGETENQFLKLLNFIKEYEFYNLGCFVYSREENTKAYSMEKHLKENIKRNRYKKIMEKQKKIVKKINTALLGKELKVNVSGFSEETELLLQGRTEFQSPDIDGITLINKGNINSPGFYKVKVTDFADYDLIGEIVDRV